MTIVPDGKDWTWVLQRPCAECGFDASTVAYQRIPELVRSTASAWPAVLARPDVRERPDPAVWSPLEYGAHVRDVHRLFTERLGLILDHDRPTFADWDQDATAIAERYHEQDPAVVGAELVAAAERAADAFGAVEPGDRDRVGLRSNGSVFTVETLARYYVHDVVHHEHDVRVDRAAGR